MLDECFGEWICVYVVLKEGIEFLDLNKFLKYMEYKKVFKWYWFEWLEIIKEILRIDSGKVKKNILLEDLKVWMKM